ncbi:MAG TPA: alpha/beta fold hydrolase [Candidatus Obscuribacterales bacterium]
MPQEINLTPTGSFLEIVPEDESSNGQRADGRKGYQALVLTGRTWGTATECRAACLLIHGLGAHSGWFEALGRRLKVRQLLALAYDQVGFGRRNDQQFMSGKQWLEDAVRAYDYLRDLVGDKPIYVMGNSMGALVALRIAHQVKPAGVVLFSPGFDGHPETFHWQYRLRTIWTALTSPETEVALPYAVDMVTREVGVRKWLEADPERRFKLPAKMMLELLKLSRDVQTRVKSAPCPVLMFTAGVERIVNNTVSEAVFDRLTCPAKHKHHYPEAWHDLMFDPVLDHLCDRTLEWIAETAPNKLIAG